MRNLIILGSGRSGTSAVAGLFRNVPGVFYGYETLAPSPGNERGYYECEVVNAINNLLIRQMTGAALLDLAPAAWLPFIENRFACGASIQQDHGPSCGYLGALKGGELGQHSAGGRGGYERRARPPYRSGEQEQVLGEHEGVR